MKELVRFNGKHILLIGGSDGIGRATAVTLARLGARVGIMARGETALAETRAMLVGEGHYTQRLDAAELSSIGAAISAAVQAHGPFDGLVYAEEEMLCAPASSLDPETLRAVFNVNLFGFLETVRQLAAEKNHNPGARIVGVSTVMAIRGGEWQTAYSASKAAMDGAVRSLAIELAEKGICINTVAPGLTETPAQQKELEAHKDDAAGLGYAYQLRKQALGFAAPQNVADAIAFLLSDAARPITGACIPVDSGAGATP